MRKLVTFGYLIPQRVEREWAGRESMGRHREVKSEQSCGRRH